MKLKCFKGRANSILQTNKCDIKNEFEKHAILLVKKCLDKKLCTNFHEYFMVNEHNINTRNNNILLKMPKVKLEFAKNGFYFMGAKLFNSLPKTIREKDTTFKKEVKLFYK